MIWIPHVFVHIAVWSLPPAIILFCFMINSIIFENPIKDILIIGSIISSSVMISSLILYKKYPKIRQNNTSTSSGGYLNSNLFYWGRNHD